LLQPLQTDERKEEEAKHRANTDNARREERNEKFYPIK
jgi:hypothetical protein